jgi:two-component system, NarL family, response regulator EvgA
VEVAVGGAGSTILIVDDDDDVRALVRMTLQREGHEIVGEAINGSEAVLLAGDSQPALIILDYKMPGMTGEETAAILRRIAPDSRILLFSAFIEGEPEWPDAFLHKDQITDLVTAVEKLLAG